MDSISILAVAALIPIKDINRTFTTPHVNRMLIIANVIVFLVVILSEFGFVNGRFAIFVDENLIMKPYYVIRGQQLYTLVTSMFLHASLIHLFGNMLFLYVFGDNIEDAFGHFSYFILYLASGLAAGFAHILSLTNPSPLDGVLGASGAISGVLGAYLVLYPKAKILTLVGYFLVPIPAIIFLSIWFVLQWFFGLFDVAGGVAYWAHVGGFIAGMILALVFGLKRKKARMARYRL